MFDATVLSKLRYAIYVGLYHGFLSAELKGQINAFLKRAFKYGFCTSVHTIDVIAEEADRSLFAKIAGSQNCLHTLFPDTVVVIDQKDMPTNYLNVVVIYTRNHLFQGACLDIVNILLW